MELSIVIVSWNVRDYLAQCLEFIFAYPPAGTFEVWVVDNASTDDSRQLVQDRFAQVQLIVNRENVGFARANNQAIRQSTGRYVLLLNPDTQVKAGALQALVEFLTAQPQVGAAGSRLVNPDNNLQRSCSPFPTLSRELWRMFHLDGLHPYALYAMHQWRLAQPQAVDVLQGASLAVRRETFDQVGLLDENYFIFTEEVDLCYRIQRSGWLLYWLPQSEVIHYGGQSTRQVAARMFLHLYQSKLQYFRKHHGPAVARLYKLILLVASLTRLGLASLIWLEPPARRDRHRELAGNYMQLLKALPGL